MVSRSHRIGTGLMTASALAFLVNACAPAGDNVSDESSAGLAATNGLAAVNGLAATNGLAAVNGLNATASLQTSGIQSGSGLMTTAAGRSTVAYLARCALPAGHSISKQDQYGNWYTYAGALGVAPGWEYGSCSDLDCQGYMSACLMAHINSAGFHVPLWLDSNIAGMGWGQSASYPGQEGTFFGNLFVTPPEGYYCDGAGFAGGANGVVAGRVNGGGSAIYRNPFGDGVLCANSSGAVPYYSAGASVPDGFQQLNYNHPWWHPITVWRGASYTPSFDTAFTYRLYALNTRANPMLIDVSGASSNPGTKLDQWPLAWNGGGSSFKIMGGPSNWTIRPAYDTSKCIDVGAGASGSVPTIQSCNSGTAQQFLFTPNGGYGTMYIKSVSSGRCLTAGSQTVAGAPTNLTDCAHVSWQEFRVLASQ
jgi:hypothetical protein